MYAAEVGVEADMGWLLSRVCERFVATDGRRNVWVAPFMRDRVLEQVPQLAIACKNTKGKERGEEERKKTFLLSSME